MLLRRGKATDEVFARAVSAKSYFYSFAPGTARTVESVETIPVADARRLFQQNKRAKLERRSDGIYVFLVGTAVGYERVEIEIA